ncbi:MAG TPA: hypothetical protein ENK43_15090 [Planctomycetes bacterium]|nr:hypothetical protein [Planctomycetota bacterium]
MMDCTRARERFSVAFDGCMPSEQQERFQTHLRSCEACTEAWREFADLFFAVRCLSGVETDKPAPYPPSTVAFRAHPRRSPWAKTAIAAGLLVVLGGVGFLAFDLGRRDEGMEPVSRISAEKVSSDSDEKPVDALLAGLPKKSAGQRLSRFHRTLAHLGALTDLGAAARTPEIVDVIQESLNAFPVEADALVLEQMDRESLGDWKARVHHFAGEGHRWVTSAESVLADESASPEVRLAQLKRLTNDQGLEEQLAEIRRLAGLYDPMPFELRLAKADTVAPILEGLRCRILDNRQRATFIIRQALRSRNGDRRLIRLSSPLSVLFSGPRVSTRAGDSQRTRSFIIEFSSEASHGVKQKKLVGALRSWFPGEPHEISIEVELETPKPERDF